MPVSTSFDPSGFISPVPPYTPFDLCNQPVGNEIPEILAFWQQVLAGNPLDLQATNPNYIGNFLAAGQGSGGNIGLFAPNYKSPRSLQMNVGIQREVRRGMVFTADFLRNIETHSLLSLDLNRDGDVSTFSKAGAQLAISDTNNDFGCGAGFDSTSIDCAIAAGATMADYAGFGLGASADFGVGCNQPVAAGGFGHACGFGGTNANQASFFMLQPVGRSEYNALQMKLSQNMNNPVRGVKAVNFQISYSLSRFNNTGGLQLTGTPGDSDQDFVLQTADNNRPGRYFGPAILDRTHQISFGGYADLPGGFRLGLISHFYSPLSSAIVSPTSGSGGEIFLTDFTGDGTVGDPLPGTHFGQFDRGTNANQLNGLINKYNSATAGQPTPAGQALIDNGVMTLAQLQALGGVAPTIEPPPPGQVDFSWLRAMDLRLSWRRKIGETFLIEPSVGFYNVANFSNFNLPPNTMNGLLFGAGSGAINGTTRADNESFRVGNGTGVYSLGAQRQIEFGLRFTF